MAQSDSSSIRILLVDDHAVVRRGLKMVLNLHPRLQVVGEAGTCAEAQQQVLDLQPDLILLDFVLPDTPQGQLCKGLRDLSPQSRILVLSGVQLAPVVRRAVAADVDGYIPKDVTPDELVAAVQQVMAGKSYIHPTIEAMLVQQGSEPAESTSESTSALEDELLQAPPELTRRELEVLTLMATTATNREIAERMHVSEETVRSHVKSVLRKLNKSSRTQAVIEGVRLGWIQI
jgi:DNA-binding NarL/FixJ family response regulator